MVLVSTHEPDTWVQMYQVRNKQLDLVLSPEFKQSSTKQSGKGQLRLWMQDMTSTPKSALQKFPTSQIPTPKTQPPAPQLTLTSSPSPSTTPPQESITQQFSSVSTVSPVPDELRGSELTFKETGYEKTFMFAKNNTFIQMDGDTIQTFQLRLCREISFQFRTRLPHGLLVYHNVKTPAGIKLDPYALYVIVEKGQLKVVHVFGNHSTSVTVGEGLNRDEWHSVMS
ncbi:hypothetical protein CpipJ_CPIJ006838 [Culex quinquefasciatus]|uniref:Laminin G domain-containing protein n=1 Tax=Culex quinquefasciatus TaxID=7176 RepID=B0WJ93_CULQU|nr:hypothetical protein CpipJ_CPIJ006838 [Culex quinquefasciatus]|eukprot:XP_001848777.1 hypothetical protein CpipJ_CPIJ006838 [Culex quinquefasciatus]